MTSDQTQSGAKAYLHEFSVMGLSFVRRPVSEPPVEGTVGVADDGHEGGWTDRQPAMFKGGEWLSMKGKALRFKPQYWIVLDGAPR
ncbi:hypothetical protein [Sphingomonas sp. RB1R13]|uniref:hypothetical protein n=1 Tax=Sphingomonas sp. RB1R13 TaxID=3096159 RepID=UPI002FC68852